MTTWLRVLLPLLLLLVVVVCCWRIERASSAIRGVARDMIGETKTLRERISKMLTSSWTDAGGVTRTVTSTQADGESWAEFVARHDAEVEAAKAQWPVG